jgi:hypothetical protein
MRKGPLERPFNSLYEPGGKSVILDGVLEAGLRMEYRR